MNDEFFGGTGPSDYYAAAAYDPNIGDVVLYGGCGLVCPNNQTWLYDQADGWFSPSQLSGNPPVVYGEGLVWDPAYDGILMIGGVGPNFIVQNWTWDFTGVSWFNATFLVGPVATLPGAGNGTAFAGVAWDGALREVVVVDGCITWDCTNVYNQVWALNDFGWFDVGYGPTSSSFYWAFLYLSAMAYDPLAHELVLFGGDSYYAGAINETYIYNASGWYNLTSSSPSCFFVCDLYPAARDAATITWDGQLQAIVMAGGTNGSSYLNDTWYFEAGIWYDSEYLGSVYTPPIFGAAMPTNSTDIAPVMIGGYTPAGFYNTTWVFEIPPTPVFYSITPSPTDVGITVNVSAGNSVGTGSGPSIYWYLYDNSTNFFGGLATGENFSSNLTFPENFSYAASGSFVISAETWDYFDIAQIATTSISVHGDVALAPLATPSTSEVGAPVTFSSGASLGTPPYTYTWGFGDHSALSAAASPAHTYAAAGSYTAWVNVSDSLSDWSNMTVPVTVNPAITTTASASVAATDLGMPVTFTATPVHGSGVYSTYSWNFGDGSPVSTATSPVYTYGVAGTYTATVTVTDSLGISASGTTTVTVNPVPTGTVTASTLTPTTATSVSFTATPTGGTPVFTYAWTFGDGGTATGATPTHKFGSTGTFTVTVTMTDSVGSVVTKTLTETVSKAPTSALGDLTSGTGLYILIGIIVLIVVGAIAAIAMRRRKGGATTAPPAPWSQGPAGAQPTAPPPSPPTGSSNPPPPSGGT